MKKERFKKAFQYSLALNVVLIIGALIAMNFFIQRRYFLKENHRKYVEEYNYLYNSRNIMLKPLYIRFIPKKEK